MLQAELSDLRERMITETENFLSDEIGRSSARFASLVPVAVKRSVDRILARPLLKIRELRQYPPRLHSA